MPSPPRDLLEQGHYARKQIFSRNKVVAWSHGRRFTLARELASARAGGALLDYGCGDGTFVALAHDLFRETVGADIDVEQVQGCTERLGTLPGVRFVSTDALRDPDHAARYDAVVVISVPIEIGPTLAVKQAVRAVAAAGGLTEYAHRERYRPSEFLRMLLAGSTSEIERPETVATTATGTSVRFHGHKGFNWHALERLIARVFRIERRLYSPVPLAGSWLNSQVWFVCRKRTN